MEKITVEYLLRQESFLRYCLHNDAEAVKYWNNWQEQHPEHAAEISEASLLATNSSLYLQAEAVKPAAMVRMQEYLQAGPVKAPVRQLNWKKITAAAAVLLVASLISIWLMQRKNEAEGTLRPLASIMKAGEEKYSIPARKLLNLADGSFVLLDSGASLRIDEAFGSEERNVYLSGTAWFKVAKDQQHPFRVITGNIRTTALGTAFRVEAPAGSNQVQVELEEGKVAVERKLKNGHELIATLMPSETITLHQQDDVKTEKKQFAVNGLQAWKAQEIIFDDAPLTDVISQLQVLYDQPILLEDDQLMNATFTGRFRNDSLSTVLDMLCFSLNRKYRTTADNKILIY
ncbi:MAG: FecR family protein [Pseudobacter sp.]|uniref:FecR family protein n=1 Tax=Pseudobacter sp. TaxID=2045420 RepID=UPI003F81B0C0